MVSHAEVPEEWASDHFLSVVYTPLTNYSEFLNVELKEQLTSYTASTVAVASPSFEVNNTLSRKIEAAINSGSHIILTGPPGTGKQQLLKLSLKILKARMVLKLILQHRIGQHLRYWVDIYLIL